MDHQNRGNRGNRDPLMVLALHPGKTLRGSLFPLLPLRVKCQNHERVPISPIFMVNVLTSEETWTTKIGEIGEIGTLSWFWHFTLRGNRGNRDPLMVLAQARGNRVKCQNHERVPISPILVLHVFSSCQDMDHQNRGNRGNRDPLMVLALHP